VDRWWLKSQCGTGEAPGKFFGGGAHRTRVATLRRRRSFDLMALRRRRWPPAVVSGPEGILQHRESSEEVKGCLIWTKAYSWWLSPKERGDGGCGFGCSERRLALVVGVDERLMGSREGDRGISCSVGFLAER
jgi:hypothetical protein